MFCIVTLGHTCFFAFLIQYFSPRIATYDICVYHKTDDNVIGDIYRMYNTRQLTIQTMLLVTSVLYKTGDSVAGGIYV